MPTVALVGNPNCGKTTIFNHLTHKWQQVGNWAGVTVERQEGLFFFEKQAYRIVDLPGTYSLTTVAPGSKEETITSEYLQSHPCSLVLNVVDALQLERNLYLTIQCLEQCVAQKIPMILVVNRIDLLKKRHIALDLKALANTLGCKVVGMVAKRKQGMAQLKEAIQEQMTLGGHCVMTYPTPIEEALSALSQIYSEMTQGKVMARYQLLRWLEGEPIPCQPLLTEKIAQLQKIIHRECGYKADIVIAKARFDFIGTLVQQVLKEEDFCAQQTEWTRRIDSLVCHRYLGLPIFFLVMYGLFFFAIHLGGAFQDFFKLASHALLIDGFAYYLHLWHAPVWLEGMFTAGIGEGMSTVLSFVPVLAAMFFALSFLEDCGYMARAAFVIDRLMRQVGLPGKSFVPMIVGFGCNVPAILGARTLESKRDRILAVMMSPFMSCGARLAIFTVFVAAFFEKGGENIVFLLYLIGILMAILTGLLLKKTLLRGKNAPLILEMPDYQWPHWKSLRRHCGLRLYRFILNAGKLIIPVCVVLSFLNHFTIEGKWLQEPSERSLLCTVGKGMVPLFKPMGIDEENWPAAVGLLTGVLAKEVVIGTLNTLYEQAAQDEALSGEDTAMYGGKVVGIRQQLGSAFASIPENLKYRLLPWKAPSVETQKSQAHTYSALLKHFGFQANAFAYLLFVLLYFPCISATAAMAREVKKGWTLFSVCWTTGLAYAVAVLYYQCAYFLEHPYTTIVWIGIWSVIGGAVLWGIQYYSKRYLAKMLPTPVIIK